MKYIILTFILLISLTQQQVPDTTLNKLKCIEEGNHQTFEQDQAFDVCVHFIFGKDFKAKKLTFKVEVDKYIALTADGVTGLFDKDFKGNDVYLVVQGYGSEKRSEVAKFKVGDKIYPQFSLVITIDEGKVDLVQWDNGNYSDLEYDKEEENNYTKQSSCGNSAKCDPQIYLSWLGQDKNGVYMTSGGLRMSRFQKYSGKELWKESQKYFK